MKRAKCVEPGIWESPWVTFVPQDKSHGVGSSQTTGMLLVRSMGKPGSQDNCEMSSRSAQVLVIFECGYLPESLVTVTTTFRMKAALCGPSEHGPGRLSERAEQ